MIVSVPQRIFNIVSAIEKVTKDPLGINFDTEMWCWVIVDEHGVIYAKLSADVFGVPPEAVRVQAS